MNDETLKESGRFALVTMFGRFISSILAPMKNLEMTDLYHDMKFGLMEICTLFVEINPFINTTDHTVGECCSRLKDYIAFAQESDVPGMWGPSGRTIKYELNLMGGSLYFVGLYYALTTLVDQIRGLLETSNDDKFPVFIQQLIVTPAFDGVLESAQTIILALHDPLAELGVDVAAISEGVYGGFFDELKANLGEIESMSIELGFECGPLGKCMRCFSGDAGSNSYVDIGRAIEEFE